jgi:hypothetical protein
MMIRDTGKDAGFSLIELAILLTIVSLMAATALQSFREYNVIKTRNDTFSHRDVVEQGLVRFIYNFRRLPCPADPALPPGAALAGFEQCLTGTGQTAVPYCNGKVCRAVGGRYTDEDGDTVKDNILTGAIPYATIGVPLSQTIDGYGSKFGYTVSEYLTRQGSGAPGSRSYSDQYGVVGLSSYHQNTGTIEKAFNTDVLNPDGTTGAADAYMFALVSYGPNRKGGYGYNGQLIAPCSGQGRDITNCDGDSSFLGPGPGLFSYVPGPNYFDDPVVDTSLVLESDKWKYASTTGIRDKNNGNNVGINTATPEVPLHVNGNILVQQYDASNFCDDKGVNCMPIAKLTSEGMSCGENGIMYGAQNNSLLCVDKLSTTTLKPKTCPSKQYVTGFDITGTPICCPATGCTSP